MAENIEAAARRYQTAWESVRACVRASNIVDDWDDEGIRAGAAYADLEEAQIELLSWLPDDKLTEFEELSNRDDQAGHARLLRFIRELQSAPIPPPGKTDGGSKETLFSIRKGLLYVAEAIDHAKTTKAFDERMTTLKHAVDSIETLSKLVHKIDDDDRERSSCSNCGSVQKDTICECGCEFPPLPDGGFVCCLKGFVYGLAWDTDHNGAVWLAAKQNDGLSEQLRQRADEIATRFFNLVRTRVASTQTLQASVDESSETGAPKQCGVVGPLTDNDRCILLAMLDLNAYIETPVSSDIILNRAMNGASDRKRAFDRLKANKLIGAKTRHGRWLTDLGKQVANSLGKSDAPIQPLIRP